MQGAQIASSEEEQESRGFAAGLKRLTKHSSVYALGAAINKAAGFLLIPLVTAYIGSRANYGVKEIVEVTLAISGQLLGISLLHGMTRFYADYPDEADKRKLVSTSLILLVLSTGLAMAFGFVFAPQLAEVLFGSAEYADAMRATAAILFFQSLAQVGLRVMQILELSGRYVSLQLAKLVLEVGLKVLFLVGFSMTYMGVILPVVIGEAIVGGGTLAFILWKCRGAFSVPTAKRLIRYSYPLMLSGLCGFVLHQADRFFVVHYHGLDAVGVYGLSYKLGYMVNALVLDSFALIWFPFVFAIADEARAAFMIRKVASYFAFVVTFISLGLALFSYELVTVMAAPEFREAFVAIPLIVLGYLFWSAYQIVSTTLYLKERTGLIALLVLAAAMVNVSLDWLLVPSFSYIGASWATVATFAFLTLATWVVSERVFPIRYELGRIVTPVVFAVLLYLAGYFWIPDGSIAWTIGWKLLLCGAFPVVLYLGGYFTREERERGFGFLRRKIAAIGGKPTDGSGT